jgi:hypothetical protein
MTPTLKSRKYITIVVNHRTQADRTGILQNETTAIEFIRPAIVMSRKLKETRILTHLKTT